MRISGVIFDFNRTLYDPDSNKVIDGGLELLDKLKALGYKLALVCKKKSASDRVELISSLGLNAFFCKILVVEGSKKVEHFQECLALMHLHSSEVVVVGDRVEEEIRVGNQIGMVTVWFKQGKFGLVEPKTEEQKPTYTIRNIEELLSLVS